jgi:ribonuclease P protein component
VSRKAGTAVARNRIRRRLRALVRAQRAQLQTGGVYLFGGGAAAGTETFVDLERMFVECLERVHAGGTA